MEARTTTVVLIAIAVIFMFIAIAFKIKSDKKWKSLPISSDEQEKENNNVKNEPLGKKPNLWGIPSWGLALLTMFLAFVVLMVVSDIIAGIFSIQESNAAELAFYILYNLIVIYLKFVYTFLINHCVKSSFACF